MNYAKTRTLNYFSPSDKYALGEARMYMLLGDPEMTIRTRPVLLIVATHQRFVAISKRPVVFPVKVTFKTKPIINATVCLWKAGEFHQMARTNGAGVAYFRIRPLKKGKSYVTVFRDDILPYTGLAEVGGSGAAFGKNDGKPTNLTPQLPNSFALRQNFPNPFNGGTRIAFDLPQNAHVSLKIYNIASQLISTLIDQNYGIGKHTIHWDDTDQNGLNVPGGTYFYKIRTNDFSSIKKMTLLK